MVTWGIREYIGVLREDTGGQREDTRGQREVTKGLREVTGSLRVVTGGLREVSKRNFLKNTASSLRLHFHRFINVTLVDITDN